MKSLVVEDDFINRRILQLMLEQYGQCDIAKDGTVAVKMFEEAIVNDKPYNLVCMDVIMPKLDGKEALKKIRTLENTRSRPNKNARVIMITSLEDKDKIMESLSNQYDGYFVKPIKKKDFIGKIKELELIPNKEMLQHE